jgi:hypothetical protein
VAAGMGLMGLVMVARVMVGLVKALERVPIRMRRRWHQYLQC